MNLLDGIEFKTSCDYPDYGVSRCGKVINLNTGKYLSIKPRRDGYVVVSLSNNKKKHKVYLHRLVAATWIGEIPENMTVNHINLVKHDNNVENLEILTQYDNVHHSVNLGSYSDQGSNSPVGSKHKISKLNEEKVAEIRRKFSSGVCKSDLARQYGVTKQNIALIIKRVSWKHVE